MLEDLTVPLFKSLTPPNASVSIEMDKTNFVLGDAAEGTVKVTSEEDFDVQEIRVELYAVERIRGALQDFSGSAETRIYSPVNQANMPQRSGQAELIMHNYPTRVADAKAFKKGTASQFPFKVTVPSQLGPTFQGAREDGSWLQRLWMIRAVVAVAGRPDLLATKEISVSMPPPPPAEPVAAAPAAVSKQDAAPQKEAPLPTNCPKCGAPFSITQEDVFVTCKYCGYSITIASREQLKRHSMLENRIFRQQAAETALKFMDKGILRVNVARDAVITNVVLRYLPFWVFPADATTSFRGVISGGSAGIRQAQGTLSDESADTVAKIGSLILAGAEAYMKTRAPSRDYSTPARRVAQTFSNHYNWVVLARQAMISEVNLYDIPIEKKIPFDQGKIPSDAEFLRSELDEASSKEQARREIEEKQSRSASAKVDTLETVTTNVVFGEGELIHAPVWFIYYALKGDNYVIAIDGCLAKPLGGGRPIFKFR